MKQPEIFRNQTRRWLRWRRESVVVGFVILLLSIAPAAVRTNVFAADMPGNPSRCVDIDSQPIHPMSSSTAGATVSDGIPGVTQNASTILLFQTQYHSDKWWGDVLAYVVDRDRRSPADQTPLWRAGRLLDKRPWQPGAGNSRQIVTYNGYSGVAFGQHAEGLSPIQQSLISQKQMDYIRGDRSGEKGQGGSFRDRTSILGDIVSSAAVYHENVVYVGANDGMLHAFAAESGEELFAYIPNLVFSRLSKLTDDAYQHQFYVDGTPCVKEADHRTLLVGGLGAGGTGYYCLDVSKPMENTAQNASLWVVWEFPDTMTASDDLDDLGVGLSKPVLVHSNAGWVVILGNGYNSLRGNAVLFVLNVDGSRIRRIDTFAGDCNGLSSPVPVDVTNDDIVDYVYAGDLKGNLWKFDLTGNDPESWDVAYYDSGTPQPLFQARDAKGRPQPITSAPDVMYHCNNIGYMVVFGTGRYLGESDFSNEQQQTVYGIWDFGDDDDDREYLGELNRDGNLMLSNQDEAVTLLEQELDFIGSSGYGDTVHVVSRKQPNYSTVPDIEDVRGNHSREEAQQPNPIDHAGWFFDLPVNRERVVSDVVIHDGNAIITSIIPVNRHSASGGSSFVTMLEACTGAGLSEPQMDINKDGVIDGRDRLSTINRVPSGMVVSGLLSAPAIVRQGPNEVLFYTNSDGGIETITQKGERIGVLYWEIVNH